MERHSFCLVEMAAEMLSNVELCSDGAGGGRVPPFGYARMAQVYFDESLKLRAANEASTK
jgi:hypothetical protein